MIKYLLKYVRRDKQKWDDYYELRLQFFNVKLIDMKKIYLEKYFYFLCYSLLSQKFP